MEKNKNKIRNMNNKYIQLFKQFIKYKKYLLKNKKYNEIFVLNKNIQNEIAILAKGNKIVNRINHKVNDIVNIAKSLYLNKNLLYIIKGSINIIEKFWLNILKRRNRLKNISKDVKKTNNKKYKSCIPKLYSKNFPVLSSLFPRNNSDNYFGKFDRYNSYNKNFQKDDNLIYIIERMLKREKEEIQKNKIKVIVKE